MKYLKQLGYNALLGAVVGGLVDLVFALFNKKKTIDCEFICDPEHLPEVQNAEFDFSRKMVIDKDTGELLIDFTHAKDPQGEMIKALNFLHSKNEL